ncbi:MAG TPA: T9SS type A sorting domain-containing protein [Gemmatimonadaceae bacterium]|nr:T9SS type A sorting domain-containing protein [Gemmatimonadaceae bacterium]
MLALSAFMPGRSAAQGISPETGGGQGAGFRLSQNYPNPVTQDTRIRFAVSETQGCTDTGRQHRVNLRIYNLLAQLVAVPVLQGGVGNAGGGEPLENLLLTCSNDYYVAYWNGKSSQTGEDVASGIYLYRLEIDGKVQTKKMIVRR